MRDHRRCDRGGHAPGSNLHRGPVGGGPLRPSPSWAPHRPDGDGASRRPHVRDRCCRCHRVAMRETMPRCLGAGLSTSTSPPSRYRSGGGPTAPGEAPHGLQGRKMAWEGPPPARRVKGNPRAGDEEWGSIQLSKSDWGADRSVPITQHAVPQSETRLQLRVVESGLRDRPGDDVGRQSAQVVRVRSRGQATGDTRVERVLDPAFSGHPRPRHVAEAVLVEDWESRGGPTRCSGTGCSLGRFIRLGGGGTTP